MRQSPPETSDADDQHTASQTDTVVRALLHLAEGETTADVLAGAARRLYRHLDVDRITATLNGEVQAGGKVRQQMVYDFDQGERGPTVIDRLLRETVFTRAVTNAETIVALGSEDPILGRVAVSGGPVVVAPVAAGGAGFGTIQLARRAGRKFETEEVALITLAAETLAVVIKAVTAQAVADSATKELHIAKHVAERRAHELEVLDRILRLLGECAVLEAALVAATKELVGLRGVDRAEISLISTAGSHRVDAVSPDAVGPHPRHGGGRADTEVPTAVTAKAIETRGPVIVYDDDEPDLLIEMLLEARMTSATAVPIVDGMTVIGTVAVASTGPHRRVQQSHVAVLEAVASAVANAHRGHGRSADA
ncbi:MAG: GAF domain-containing protein [Actinomycetota bacterium]